jgi:hypothetical protein
MSGCDLPDFDSIVEAYPVIERWPAELREAFAEEVGIVLVRIADRQRTSSTGCGCGCGSCGDQLRVDGWLEEANDFEGERLDRADRQRFEKLFEVDLRDLRLHAGPLAARAAASRGARAFTYGRNIFLAADAPREGTVEGDALIAHEIVHVLQQRNGRRVGFHLPIEAEELERQAQLVGNALLEGKGFELRPMVAPLMVQAQNPIIAKCGAICPQVIIDPTNGVPCGLADCDWLGFFPPVIVTSFCVFRCAVNLYGAFILNTRFGPMGPFFTDTQKRPN